MTPEEIGLAKRLGRKVQKLRAARGWSQAELAEQLGLSTHYVGLIERGKRLPALGTFLQLGEVLVTSLDALAWERHEPWVEQVAEAARRVPQSHRPVVLAMLKAAAEQRRRRG